MFCYFVRLRTDPRTPAVVGFVKCQCVIKEVRAMPRNNLLPTKNLDIAGWKQLYESAILEIDNARLPKRIAEARCAILDRAEEILTAPTSDERNALNDALRTLRLLDEVAARERSSAA
jgi:hypothetical protein